MGAWAAVIGEIVGVVLTLAGIWAYYEVKIRRMPRRYQRNRLAPGAGTPERAALVERVFAGELARRRGE